MKKRTKILISILAGFIVLLGCGVWLFQSLRSEPAPTGEEAAPLTNLTAMLNAHDTIVTAQYQESSDPYTTDGGESWYVDSTYTVQESLRGELQPGDTLTFSEPVSSKTGTPYSQKVAIDATDSTLLFCEKRGTPTELAHRLYACSRCKLFRLGNRNHSQDQLAMRSYPHHRNPHERGRALYRVYHRL